MNNCINRALCIASALALGGVSEQAVAAGCSYTTTAQFFCDDQTIYYSGNPLLSNSRDYTTFDEVLINTSQSGTTTPLQGWGVYLDSTGYKFKNLVINTTGSEADGIHSKNAGGRGCAQISPEQTLARTLQLLFTAMLISLLAVAVA